jgi:Methyltransferase domain
MGIMGTMTIRAVAKDLLPPVLLRAAKAVIPRGPTVLPYEQDEFLYWLSLINPGTLNSDNLPLFNHAIQRMPEGGAVVEVGSWCGMSINHLIHMMQNTGRSNEVFSVDEWHFEDGDFFGDGVKVAARSGALRIPGSNILFSDYRDLAIDTFRRNLMLFHPDRLPHHIVASSDKFFELWTQRAEVVDFFGRTITLGGPISLAYIDGDHSYLQSWRDFENVDRFLLPGGFIIFDDSADWCAWESKRSAREAASRPDYELVAKAPNYCIAKRH